MGAGEGLRDGTSTLASRWPLSTGAGASGGLARACAIAGFDALSLGAGLVLLPLYAEAALPRAPLGGLGRLAIGGAIVLLPCLAGIASTRVTQRVSRRLVFAGAGICRGLSLAAAGFAPSFGWLCAGTALWGVGAGSPAIAADSVAEVAPAEQRLGASLLLVVAVCLGLAAGAHLGTALSALLPRFALGVGSALCFASVGWALLEPPGRRRDPTAEL